MKPYEGLFLVNPAQASTDWEAVLQHTKEIITKHGGKILQANKWAERKLAFPIKRQKRGTYILVQFEAPPESLTKINADCRLSEIILRAMILVAPPKAAKKKTVARPKETAAAKAEKTSTNS